VWIRQNQFTFNLPVSLYTCSTVDSYHVNTSIINGQHGMIENEEAPKNRDGKFVFEMIKSIMIVFGKPVKG
jgi:hypothetical protein